MAFPGADDVGEPCRRSRAGTGSAGIGRRRRVVSEGASAGTPTGRGGTGRRVGRGGTLLGAAGSGAALGRAGTVGRLLGSAGLSGRAGAPGRPPGRGGTAPRVVVPPPSPRVGGGASGKRADAAGGGGVKGPASPATVARRPPSRSPASVRDGARRLGKVVRPVSPPLRGGGGPPAVVVGVGGSVPRSEGAVGSGSSPGIGGWGGRGGAAGRGGMGACRASVLMHPPFPRARSRVLVRGPPSSIRTHTRTGGPASGASGAQSRSSVRARHSTGCPRSNGNQSTSPGDLPGTSPYPAVILSGRLRS